MLKDRMEVVHQITNCLRLKANAEIIKCTDNGLNSKVRLRTDDKLIDIKVEVYDLDIEKTAYPLGNGKSSRKDSIR